TFRLELAITACSTAPASARRSSRASADSLRRSKRSRRRPTAAANEQRSARPSRPADERNATLAPHAFCSQYSEAAQHDRRSRRLASGRNCKMSDWKVLYRDELDRD